MAILEQHTPSLVKRGFSATRLYMFGFQGQEKDDEVFNVTGSSYTAEFWQYDSRFARFLSVDPFIKSYLWYTPYQFVGNKLINSIDMDGLKILINFTRWDSRETRQLIRN